MKQIFKNIMESTYSERIEKKLVDGQGFVSCDSYAMAAATEDTYITETEHRAVTVELAGNDGYRSSRYPEEGGHWEG